MPARQGSGTAADQKTDARNPDTVADRDPTSPASYPVHETDEELNANFGFRRIDVPDDLHDPKPGEGPVEPVRMPSVAGTGDTMRERAEYREKQASKGQNKIVDTESTQNK
jgi:hypothetical protein